MRDIVAVDEGIVPYEPAAVCAALADAAAYPEWWPRPYRFERVAESGDDTHLLAHYGRFLSWDLRVDDVADDHVSFVLSGGSLEGRARWTVRRVLEGTAVVLRIDARVRPLWLRLLSWRYDVRRWHARRMRGVFDALEERLAGLGVERLPEPSAPEPRRPEAG